MQPDVHELFNGAPKTLFDDNYNVFFCINNVWHILNLAIKHVKMIKSQMIYFASYMSLDTNTYMNPD
jgi:hypothetical protein